MQYGGFTDTVTVQVFIMQLLSLIAGRLCSCSETDLAAQTRESCGSREDYERYLDCSCRDGEPAILTWTPDEETPDVVYYQVTIYPLCIM